MLRFLSPSLTATPVLVMAFALTTALVGCLPQDMADQPRYEAYEESRLFDNGMASRPLVDGTVARGHLRTDTAFFEGQTEDGELVETIPEKIREFYETDEEILAAGELQYKIYCSHCHGLIGGGKGGPEKMQEFVGMVVKRGFPMPSTYHSDRLRGMPDGHFYDVITNGYGVMKPHADLVDVEDRWAIVAWIRTLQLSQSSELVGQAETEEPDTE